MAQAALYVALRDQIQSSKTSVTTPWTTISSRRFGGDAYERNITLQFDGGAEKPTTTTVHLRAGRNNKFDISVTTPSGTTSFSDIPAELSGPSSIATTLNGENVRTTIVSQLPPAHVPASNNPNTMEQLHIFSDGQKYTLVVPSPNWLLSLGSDLLGTAAASGALRAPMPSLVVDVKVNVGDRVEKGQAVVVLESMKTETVLRSDVTGVVKAVGCKKGEMVAEGKELVDIEVEVKEEN